MSYIRTRTRTYIMRSHAILSSLQLATVPIPDHFTPVCAYVARYEVIAFSPESLFFPCRKTCTSCGGGKSRHAKNRDWLGVILNIAYWVSDKSGCVYER